MKVEGTYAYPAPPDRVWTRLLDPQALRECIPGCESLEPAGEDRWSALLNVGAGPIRGRYNGSVAIADKREPLSYTLQVEGRGGPGFVKGTAHITLTPSGEGTQVGVTADGQVGGTVAAVGQRMLAGVAKVLMGQFFDCLATKL